MPVSVSNQPFFVREDRPQVGRAFAATILAAVATIAGPPMNGFILSA